MASHDWTYEPEADISMPMETKNTFVHYSDLGTPPSPRAHSDTECDYASMQMVLDAKIQLASGAKSKSRPGKRLRDRMKQRSGEKKVAASDHRSAAYLPSNYKLFVALSVCMVLPVSLTWIGLAKIHARQLAVVDRELRAKESIIDELNKALLLEKERQEYLLGQEEDEKFFSKAHQRVEHVQSPMQSLLDKGLNYILLQVLLVAFASGFGIQSFAAILRSPEGSSKGGFVVAVSTIFIMKCMVADGALEPLMCGTAPSLIQFAVSIVAELFVPNGQDLTEGSRVCVKGSPSGSSYGTVTVPECQGIAQVRMDDGTQMSMSVASLSRAPKPGGASMMGIVKGLLVSLPIWCFGLTTLTKALVPVVASIPLWIFGTTSMFIFIEAHKLGPVKDTTMMFFTWLVCFFIAASTCSADIDGVTRIPLSIFTGILGMIFSNECLGALFEWQARTMCVLSVQNNPASPASCQALSW